MVVWRLICNGHLGHFILDFAKPVVWMLICKGHPPPYFEAVYCFICGHRMVAVARYQMINLVLDSSIGWWSG